MKNNKLKLDLDSLQVASFATQAPKGDAQGTVAAHSDPVTAVTIQIGVWLSTLLLSD